MNISDLDALHDKLQRALDAVEDMKAAVLAGRAETKADSYAAVADECVQPNSTLEEALECTDHLHPERVRGWAVVSDFWAVRVPIGDAEGNVEGDEIQRFATQAEAQAFCDSLEAEVPEPPATGPA